ncbi:heavy-metal-associated domain-containing protein [Rhodovulum euryhalinum]|uniref:Copper chaperone n=1 Tax=Rhodovulum euryhalinum TaxID=35805 RepID=A0A4R2KSP8_9RHOB|nr:heavy-metal-associated domain-containing protein [Rhodovulum euryhalinum]TCO74059.1 copper chaperone [Rhodovulum euryhalinum]
MRFSIPDMICGHCTGTIETAIRGLDPSARIDCNLDAHTVRVETVLDPSVVIAAIEEVGYGVTQI